MLQNVADGYNSIDYMLPQSSFKNVVILLALNNAYVFCFFSLIACRFRVQVQSFAVPVLLPHCNAVRPCDGGGVPCHKPLHRLV